jgi:hypothetical protein
VLTDRKPNQQKGEQHHQQLAELDPHVEAQQREGQVGLR